MNFGHVFINFGDGILKRIQPPVILIVIVQGACVVLKVFYLSLNQTVIGKQFG